MDICNSILIEEIDNVVTTLRDIDSGGTLTAIGLDYEVSAKEKISKGHKVAIKEIPADSEVIKYGKAIGISLVNIKAGSLVHTHNLRSNRGKELREG